MERGIDRKDRRLCQSAEQLNDPVLDLTGALVRTGRSANTTRASFVGDLNLTLVRQISDVWGFRGGYNLVFVEGVALAPNQLDFTNTPASATQISSGSSLFVHGFSFGVEGRW